MNLRFLKKKPDLLRWTGLPGDVPPLTSLVGIASAGNPAATIHQSSCRQSLTYRRGPPHSAHPSRRASASEVNPIEMRGSQSIGRGLVTRHRGRSTQGACSPRRRTPRLLLDRVHGSISTTFLFRASVGGSAGARPLAPPADAQEQAGHQESGLRRAIAALASMLID